jgi:hypothetical protein
MSIKFSNNEKEVINISQDIFDNFNKFIFSDDTKIFAKMVARTIFFNEVKDVPGDIVECGVYKGSGLLTWLKLKKTLSPNAFKKIIGFDMFDSESLLNSLSGHDKETMSTLFSSRQFEYKNYDTVLHKTILDAGFDCSNFELIQGDISKTSEEFVTKRPGFKISLLYLDMDLEKPTYDALLHFWPRISKGGLVIFDEYGYHQWSESKGADKFANENNLEIKMLNYNAPTAFIKKT